MEVRPIDGNKLVQSLKKHRLHILLENENDGATVFDDIVDWIKYAPTLTPQNEPLTIEQLREMDGEPVWCKELKSWALIYTESGKWEPHLILPDLSPVINFPVKTHNRTYTLYRRPPEGEEDTI